MRFVEMWAMYGALICMGLSLASLAGLEVFGISAFSRWGKLPLVFLFAAALLLLVVMAIDFPPILLR